MNIIGKSINREERDVLRAKCEEITGTKFCRRCKMHRKVEGGTWRRDARGMKTWDCACCSTATKGRNPKL